MKTAVIALRVTFLTLVLTGLLYPLLVTGLAQSLFPDRANGSLVQDEHGRWVGSEWIGQTFLRPEYVQSRPSAAGDGYDSTASSGSNLGPTSARLRVRTAATIERLSRENPDAKLPVPADLVTTSGSGLDPHLSPEAAFWQVERVARARGVAPERVRALVAAQIEAPDWGVLGEPRVNVLLLNLALDRHFGSARTGR